MEILIRPASGAPRPQYGEALSPDRETQGRRLTGPFGLYRRAGTRSGSLVAPPEANAALHAAERLKIREQARAAAPKRTGEPPSGALWPVFRSVSRTLVSRPRQRLRQRLHLRRYRKGKRHRAGMRAQALRVHSGVGREGLSRRGGKAEKSRQSRRDQTSLESPGSELCHVLAPLCLIDGFTLFDLTLSPSCFNLLLRITCSDKEVKNSTRHILSDNTPIRRLRSSLVCVRIFQYQ